MNKGETIVVEGKKWKVLGTVGELWPEMFGATRPPRLYPLNEPIHLPIAQQTNLCTAS
jgi:hypothetical protein